jgi:GT2 family glycosyltransferase
VIFSFIKYTQPGWYFNLKPYTTKITAACYYHPDYCTLPNDVQVEHDTAYEQLSAQYADIAYRAWYMGHLQECDASTIEKIKQLPKPSIADEYRFVIKYWGIHWGLFALLIRLFSFKNPFIEIKSFKKNAKTPKTSLYNTTLNRLDYTNANSILFAEQPLVSVIIPTLNRYTYLNDVLTDLEKQTWNNFDIIIVDQSENFNREFYNKFNLKLQVIQQKEKLLWTARNNAVKMSKANYLLFFDDDSRIDSDWIEQHMKTIDYFKADISAGVSLAVVGAKVPQSYAYFRWADQFDSGNALVKRAVFKEIGLFDLQFNKERMGDAEFGLRAYLNGFKSISNPYAKRVHLKVASGGLREIGHWDGFRPKKWFAPKPIPSVTYLYKKYYPKRLYKNAVYLGIMLSNLPYKHKGNKWAILSSLLLTIVKLPILIIQFQQSKKIANQKLKQGGLIEVLY